MTPKNYPVIPISYSCQTARVFYILGEKTKERRTRKQGAGISSTREAVSIFRKTGV